MDPQQVNTGEVSQPYTIPPGMTPEAAAARAQELTADKDFGARLLKGGTDSREAREWDALQRLAVSAQPGAQSRQAIPKTKPARTPTPTPATAQPSAGLTTEQAKTRLAELRSDATWREKFIAGDGAARKEFDRLNEIAVGVQPKAAGEVLTPEQARVAALNEVPVAPEGYEDLPFRHDDMPTPEGRTEIQGLMHTAGLTRSEAATMISFAATDVAKWTQMDDTRRELHIADSLGRFNKMHGDQAPAMLDGARRLVAEITAKDGGRLREILEETGAGASLAVINALAAAAKRRYRA